MDDRRKHSRYSLKQPVTAAVQFEDNHRLVVFSVMNISREGMLIAGELEACDLQDKSVVIIELFSSRPRELIVKCLGKIIDFRGEGKFGVHIEKITASDQYRMMGMCADFEKMV